MWPRFFKKCRATDEEEEEDQLDGRQEFRQTLIEEFLYYI
jgi:hypothetical protein